jgi:peroxiredoxin
MRSLSKPALFLVVVLLSSCHLMPWAQKTQNPQLSGGVPIGQVAPDIEGEDVDGVRFKLSDYRGKVVALVFWGTWCPPCCAQLPHEQALVARLQGQPFALLSVNGDRVTESAERDQLKRFLAKHHVTWRQWCDGGPGGPIAQQYQVTNFPTVYVMDGGGVVRYRDVRGPDLDRAVDELLRETQAARR